MTLEQLLACDSKQLEQMTDAQVEAFCSQHYKVTRPELAVSQSDIKQAAIDKLLAQGKAKMRAQKRNKEQELYSIAASMGIQLPKMLWEKKHKKQLHVSII